MNSLDRDLFENGHRIFISSKLDFIWIFEISAVLKEYGPVHVKLSKKPHKNILCDRSQSVELRARYSENPIEIAVSIGFPIHVCMYF